jgi:hypothetical protein
MRKLWAPVIGLWVLIAAFAVQADFPTTVTPQAWTEIGAPVSLSAGTSSTRVLLLWPAASGNAPATALVCNDGAVSVYVALGDVTVAATTSSFQIRPGVCSALALNGATYLAGITGSSTATITISTGNGSAASGGSSSSSSGATLGANTFTATQTINPAANTSSLVTTGSHTGSDATPDFSLSTTLNTSGSPDVFKLAVTDTARGAATKLFNIYAGASGTTSEFSVDRSGNTVSSGYFQSAASTGFLFDNGLISIRFNGAVGAKLGSATPIVWTQSTDSNDTADLFLRRDGPGILAQRNSTNAQTFRVYNTYTDASNGEWGAFDWQGTANVLSVGTKMNGTGVARNMQFLIGGVNKLDYGQSTTGVWTVAASMFSTGAFQAGAASYFAWNGRTLSRAPSDGVLTLSNNAETDFSRLQFGGTTSSFPALKRFGTAPAIRLADDTVGAAAVLTACASAGEGALAVVTDSNTNTWGATVAGSGSNHVLAYCNGTNWTVAAK